jgi:hypothetical protein
VNQTTTELLENRCTHYAPIETHMQAKFARVAKRGLQSDAKPKQSAKRRDHVLQNHISQISFLRVSSPRYRE